MNSCWENQFEGPNGYQVMEALVTKNRNVSQSVADVIRVNYHTSYIVLIILWTAIPGIAESTTPLEFVLRAYTIFCQQLRVGISFIVFT